MNGSTSQFQEIDWRVSWKALYDAAINERDTTALSQRIVDAQKAIAECALALLQANIDNKVERRNLTKAHLFLEKLKRLYPLAKDAA